VECRYKCGGKFSLGAKSIHNLLQNLLVANTIVLSPLYLLRVYDFWCLNKIYLLVHKIIHKIFGLYLRFLIRYFYLYFIIFSRLYLTLFFYVQGFLGWPWTHFGVVKYTLICLFMLFLLFFILF